MGSPTGEADRDSDEKQHWRQIGRRYAIGTKSVTVAEFKLFLKAHREVKHLYTEKYSPDRDGPIISVTWYEAAQYCRWLSEQEGFPEEEMIYPNVAVIEKSKDGLTPLRLPENHLKRKGYRLPTEAEWEYACRAGTQTSRYCGSSLELLPPYAWYINNSQGRTWPVGQKKPNDLGLFDINGNVWNWCQNPWADYPASTTGPVEDKECIKDVLYDNTKGRALRGASFRSHVSDVRASYRNDARPAERSDAIGFRVARTCD